MEPLDSRRMLFRSLTLGMAGGLVIGLAFIGGYLYGETFIEVEAEPLPLIDDASFELLNEANGLLETYFLGEMPDEEARLDGAIHGLVGSFDDPNTFYVEPQRHEVEATNLHGSFGGIGAEIGRNETGEYVLVNVFRDGPGYEAGLRDGDVIVAVDGAEADTSAPTSDDLIAAIRGPVGEPVVLTIRRGEERLDIEVVRGEISIPSVTWRLLAEDSRIGYVHISRFTASAPDQLDTALNELIDQGAAAFVLDLRGNGGGLVDASIDIAGEFLSGKLVASEERSIGGTATFNASPGGTALDEPLVVLVDGGTASASEIVAGALQDHERATIIGTQTFGKGSVQVIKEMSNDSSLHITWARWYTPNNNPIDKRGLEPDVIVEPAEGLDAPLATAVTLLGETLTVAEADGDPAGR